MQEESLGIVIGTITECERVPGTKRLYRLVIDIGEKSVEIASALPHFLEGVALLGRQVPVKTDVSPVVMHGVTSTARLIAIKNRQGMPILLSPETAVANGDAVV